MIAEEYVEAKTATDDRRPILQNMIDRACAPDHPYDAIVFYAFNRFFRNVAEMELTIRKLRKHGVEVVSVTQPTGDDPSQILVRQIIGAFDEHTSREIAAAVNAEKIDAFARLMKSKLDAGDTNTRKGYIRSIIDAVEVDDRVIRIIGGKDILQAAIAGKQTENGSVRGFVRKWRTRHDSNV
ncbi:recombinase family protein [Nitrobacter vulgaris]|uniref:recombinase family protein n=1 Tax=Nitrobacter vulgaris TaxID=29421 RepID=UPI00286AD97B|nr:recombinase family protein [Nitrobacter vulgaris]